MLATANIYWVVVVNSLVNSQELRSVGPLGQHHGNPDGVVVMQQPVYSMDYATGQLYVQRLEPYGTEPVVYAPSQTQIVSKQ